MSTPRLVCLLPVRNATADLPGYFESVANIADAVVALDDGSTDDTRDVLNSQPLVEVLLTNPRRESYRGWHDGQNRNRLLRAAGELAPDWILSLDADERLDGGDAAALREFIQDGANPTAVYGLRVHRMIGNLTRYDRARLWVYRLFSFQPGQAFADRDLHPIPVPVSIPLERWLQTTLRIQHVASLTDARRRARFEKYLEADPDRAFQPDYQFLLDPPEELRPWQERPAGLPVVVGPAFAPPELAQRRGAMRNRMDADEPRSVGC